MENNFNPQDIVKVDIPLFIRLLEYAREDAKTDMDLHNVAENAIKLSETGRTLHMSDYAKLVQQPEMSRVQELAGINISELGKLRPLRSPEERANNFLKKYIQLPLDYQKLVKILYEATKHKEFNFDPEHNVPLLTKEDVKDFIVYFKAMDKLIKSNPSPDDIAEFDFNYAVPHIGNPSIEAAPQFDEFIDTIFASAFDDDDYNFPELGKNWNNVVKAVNDFKL